MKRVMAVIVILAVFFPVAYNAVISKNTWRMLTAGEQAVKECPGWAGWPRQEALGNAALDRLAEDFRFPERTYEGLKQGTEISAFPAAVIHEFGKALFCGTSHELLASMNDEGLMITVDDFTFQPKTGEDITYSERLLNEAVSSGGSGFCFYKCGVSGDGTEDIIIYANPDVSEGDGYVFLLESAEDGYIYAGYSYIGSHSGIAVFEYGGLPYMAAGFDGGNMEAETIELYSLSEGEDGKTLTGGDCIYLQKKYAGCGSYVLYERPDTPLAEKARAYSEEICEDLIFSDRMDACFVGDEKKSAGLLEDAWENNSELKFRDIFSADLDNDGQEEYFDRNLHKHRRKTAYINWYDPEKREICSPPLNVWVPAGFYTSQMWVRIMEGKTVTFFLYQKEQEDIYLLDARICENGITTPLMGLMIDTQWEVQITDHREDADYFDEKEVYSDPDYGMAFPDDLQELAKRMAARVQEPFQAVRFEHEEIPASLIVGLEQALFQGKTDLTGLGATVPEADPDVYFDLTGAEDREDFDRYNNHVYKFSMEGGEYYLTVTDMGGTAKFADISMRREENGALTDVFGISSLDMDARILQHEGEKYLLEQYYNYYSKYRDTFYIRRLTPDGLGGYVKISFLPEGFIWEKLYDGRHPGSEAVSAYVDSVKEALMAMSPITDDIRIFTGDESPDVGHEELLRLKSVAGAREYYRIDMNNDGKDEYLERHHWFPSNYTVMHLVENVYRITEAGTRRMNLAFDKGREILLQLWFKELEGKVFTFRLYLLDGYNYLLNVSLIEGTEVTQVQSWFIVPNRGFFIETGEETMTGKG